MLNVGPRFLRLFHCEALAFASRVIIGLQLIAL